MALYGLVSVAFLFVVLVLFLRKARAPGSVAALFAIWYATGRIFLDFLRTDPARAFSMTGTQLVSVLVVPAVLAWLVLRERRGWRAERLEGRPRTPTLASTPGGKERATA